MTTETTELATQEERQIYREMPLTNQGIQLGTFGEVWYFAGIIAKSQFAPKGMTTREDIMSAIVYGRSVGINNPFQALQNVAVINGRPSMWGDMVLGLVEGSGLLEDIDEHYEGNEDSDDFAAVCTAKRKGRPTPRTTQFSVRDAKRANLWGKDIWAKYPKRMLQMRARGFTLRDAFPDVLKGIFLREEVEDYIDVTATPTERPTTLDAFVARHDAGPIQPPPFVASKPDPEPEPEQAKPRRGRPRKNQEPAQEEASSTAEEEATQSEPTEPAAQDGLF